VREAIGAAAPWDAGGAVRAVATGPLALLTTSIPDAAAMDAGSLRASVARTYVALGDALATLEMSAVRLWNYLPNPGQPMGQGLDRYMAFNAGRHEGYGRWFNGNAPFGSSLPTASGVGIEDAALVVHCLASKIAGHAVENPRQKPAWQYSARYGPLPPSFSRATIATIRGRRLLLIGGTASILGEDSVHIGDVGAQLDETLENLTALISAARGGPSLAARDALCRIRDMRVYIRRDEDAALVDAALRQRCPDTGHVELVTARLCRPELLVEIEGVAEV
jgi:chorismate lyase/3-hydroxybenzoate synthase